MPFTSSDSDGLKRQKRLDIRTQNRSSCLLVIKEGFIKHIVYGYNKDAVKVQFLLHLLNASELLRNSSLSGSGHKFQFLFSFQLSKAARNCQTRRFLRRVVCEKQVLCYRVLIQSYSFIFTTAAKELSAVLSTALIRNKCSRRCSNS